MPSEKHEIVVYDDGYVTVRCPKATTFDDTFRLFANGKDVDTCVCGRALRLIEPRVEEFDGGEPA